MTSASPYFTDVAGSLVTTVQISGTSIKSSPFTQTVLPGSPSAARCSAEGSGLKGAVAGNWMRFYIEVGTTH